MDPKVREAEEMFDRWGDAVVFKFHRILGIAKGLGLCLEESFRIPLNGYNLSIRGNDLMVSPVDDSNLVMSPKQFVKQVGVDPVVFLNMVSSVDKHLDELEAKIKGHPGKLKAAIDEARRVVAEFELDKAADPRSWEERQNR